MRLGSLLGGRRQQYTDEQAIKTVCQIERYSKCRVYVRRRDVAIPIHIEGLNVLNTLIGFASS